MIQQLLSGVLASYIDITVSAVLVLLLLLHELVRVAGGPRAAGQTRLLRIAIAPLLLVFTLMITARLTDGLTGGKKIATPPVAQVPTMVATTPENVTGVGITPPDNANAPPTAGGDAAGGSTGGGKGEVVAASATPSVVAGATASPLQPTAAPTAPPAPPLPMPGGTAALIGYTVRDGDTLAALAQRFDTSVAALLAMNQGTTADSLAVGAVLQVPVTLDGQQAFIYTVRAGDTLKDLALRFGSSVPELVALNPQIAPDSLVIGDQIRLPVG